MYNVVLSFKIYFGVWLATINHIKAANYYSKFSNKKCIFYNDVPVANSTLGMIVSCDSIFALLAGCCTTRGP
jgi:hypothetical protein